MKKTNLLIFDGQTEELLTVLSINNNKQCKFSEAEATEQLNRDFLFDFKVPADHEDAKHIKEGNLVAYKDIDGDFQLFQIYKTEEVHTQKNIEIQVMSEHAFYELADDIVKDSRVLDGTAHDALSSALSSSRWSVGIVDSLGTGNINFYYSDAVSNIQNVINTFGGEVKFRVVIEGNKITGRFVDLLTRRGSDTGNRFEYTRDLIEVKRTVDSSGLKTALYGRGKGEEIEETGGYTRKPTFAEVEWSVANGDPVDKPLGQEWVGLPEALSKFGRNHGSRHRFGTFDVDSSDPVEILQQTYDQLLKVSNPLVTYEIKVVDLEFLTGYDHKKIRLGDTIFVIDKDLGLRIEARVIEIKRVLNEPDKTEVVLGNFIDNITDYNNKIDQIESVIKDREGVWDKVDEPVTDEDIVDIAPSAPSEVSATGLFKSIFLKWSFNSSISISAYEVYASRSQGFTPDSSNMVFRGKAGGYAHEANTNETWYFRVRAVNPHGTPSPFTSEFSASTVRIDTPDFEELSVTNAIIGYISADKITFGTLDGNQADIVNINASNITTGTLASNRISIGNGTIFDSGYDPTTKATQQDIDQSIDNLQVGGQNLLVGTREKVESFNYATSYNNMPYHYYGYAWNFSFTVDLVEDQTYTISVPVYNESTTKASVARISIDGTNHLFTIQPRERKTIKHTFTQTSPVVNAVIRFLTHSDTYPTLAWSFPQLEVGEKATAWGQAYVDSLPASQIAGLIKDGQIESASRWDIQGTYIDENGVYTGTVVANQIVGGTISGVEFKTIDTTNISNITINAGEIYAKGYEKGVAPYPEEQYFYELWIERGFISGEVWEVKANESTRSRAYGWYIDQDGFKVQDVNEGLNPKTNALSHHGLLLFADANLDEIDLSNTAYQLTYHGIFDGTGKNWVLSKSLEFGRPNFMFYDHDSVSYAFKGDRSAGGSVTEGEELLSMNFYYIQPDGNIESVGGIVLENYNTGGTGWYGISERYQTGLAFRVRDDLMEHDAMKIDSIGNSYFFYNVDIDGNLTVDGNLNTGGNLTVGDKLTVKSETVLERNLTVGTSDYISHLSVSNGTVFAGGVDLKNDYVRNDIDQTMDANLTVTGTLDVSTNLNVSGSASANSLSVTNGITASDVNAPDMGLDRLYVKGGDYEGLISHFSSGGISISSDSTELGASPYVWLGYYGGTEVRAFRTGGVGYIPVRASGFPSGSLEEFKTNITEWEATDILERYKNDITIYEYNLKSDIANGKIKNRFGMVIGDGYDTPVELIDEDGIEQYALNSWNVKAIQALIDRVESLETRIKELEGNDGI